MTRRPKAPPPRKGGQLRFLLGLGSFVLVLVGVIFLWPRAGEAPAAANTGPPGRLAAVTPTVDLGRVPFDREVQARFELVNNGGQAVRLLGTPGVRTLEGC